MASVLEFTDARARSAAEEVDLRRKFTIAEYTKMAEQGILGGTLGDERTELLYGEIFRMMPIGPPHSECVTELAEYLRERLPKQSWRIVTQATLEVDEHMPELDLYVARGSRRALSGRFPKADELALVVEVADSSLSRDRGLKLSLYAESMISTYWIVNLLDRQIEVYTDPFCDAQNQRTGYRSTRVYGEQEPLAMKFGEVEVTLTPVDVLPLKDESNSSSQ